MKTFRILMLVAAAGAAPCTAQQRGATVEEAARSISADDLAWRVGVIAHDSMAGRDTPSPGLESTAEWIASEFRRLGLRGGAEGGSFIQRYPLLRTTVEARVTAGPTELVTGEHLLPARGSSGSGTVSGEVALVSGSYGPRSRIPIDRVRGRHAVIVTTPGASPRDRSTLQLANVLRQAGAASVLFSRRVDEATWAARLRRQQASVRPAWRDAPTAPPASFAATLDVRASALGPVLARHGVELARLEARADGPIAVDPVAGLTLEVRVERRTDEITAPNVVGILDGSDPELRAEHVVFSGHMDHVGIGAPDADGDSIFNGADDDASGTAAVMEVAEAMASLETGPRRSMIFLLVSGEEKGLWGSEWYAENPSVPIDGLVANLNTDMVARNWPDTIVAIGKEHSDLGETLNRVNGAHPELRMTAIDDLWPDERFYFRSDHYNFARKGVPVLFFFNGTHDDYHGRDDEPDRIDAEKAARIAKLVFYLGMEIGDADDRPKWNPESYARIVSDR